MVIPKLHVTLLIHPFIHKILTGSHFGSYLFTSPQHFNHFFPSLSLQPLVTAACSWRRAACNSWSSFTHTHRRTLTSKFWPRASWRACSTTELAPASLRPHTQVAVCRHSKHTKGEDADTFTVTGGDLSHISWSVPTLKLFSFRLLDQEVDVSWVPPHRNTHFIRNPETANMTG